MVLYGKKIMIIHISSYLLYESFTPLRWHF